MKLPLLTICAAAFLSPSLHAQTSFTFNFESSGTFAITDPVTLQVHTDHPSIASATGANPLGVTAASKDQSAIPTANPLVFGIVGSFLWATGIGDIFGSFSGLTTFTSPNLSSFNLSPGSFTITGGTSQYLGVTGGGTVQGPGYFTSNASGNSQLAWVGTATTVPEPGSLGLLAAGAVVVLLAVKAKQGSAVA